MFPCLSRFKSLPRRGGGRDDLFVDLFECSVLQRVKHIFFQGNSIDNRGFHMDYFSIVEFRKAYRISFLAFHSRAVCSYSDISCS